MARSRRTEASALPARRAKPRAKAHATASVEPAAATEPAKAPTTAAKPRKKKVKSASAAPAIVLDRLPPTTLAQQELSEICSQLTPQIDEESQIDAMAEQAILPAALAPAPHTTLPEAAEAGGTPSPLGEFVFDPFREPEAEAWAAPSEAEFAALLDGEAEAHADDAAPSESALEAPVPVSVQGTPSIPAVSAGSANRHGYLANARRAAQLNVTPPEKSYTLFGLELSKHGVVALASSSVFALGLLGIGLTMNAPRAENAQRRLGPAAAEAVSPAAAQTSAALFESYAAAMRHLRAGSPRAAFNALRSVAEAEFAPAQYQLGKLYETGMGVRRDVSEARRWTERAARAGHCRAMHDTGVYYARGEGAPLDETTAYRWFHQAALQGVADSQFNLGVLYQQGRGVTANASEALFWFLLAARAGDGDAVDRAVDMATQLSAQEVARARARARAFEPQPAAAQANIGEDGACAASAAPPDR